MLLSLLGCGGALNERTACLKALKHVRSEYGIFDNQYVNHASAVFKFTGMKCADFQEDSADKASIVVTFGLERAKNPPEGHFPPLPKEARNKRIQVILSRNEQGRWETSD